MLGTNNRNYASLMWTEESDALEVVRQEFEDWLRVKGHDVHLDPGVLTLNGASAQMLKNEFAGGSSARFSLRETNDKGRWNTQVLAFAKSGGATWIRITVTSDQGHWVAVPKLARNLIVRLNLMDGSLGFSDKPRVVNENDVDRFLEVLTDPDRQGLVLAAGSTDTDIPFDAFVRKMGEWTSQVQGMAQVVVLAPTATETVRDRLGRLAPRPWTLRTFYPGVDVDLAEDSLRHRFLSTLSLATMTDHRVRRLLGDIARRHAAERALPPDLRRVRRDFERIASRLVFDIDQVPTTGPAADASMTRPAVERDQETEPVIAQSELLQPLRALLGVPEIDSTAVLSLQKRLADAEVLATQFAKAKEQSDRQQDKIEALEDQVQLEAWSREEAELDAASWKEHADDLQQSLRVLSKELAQPISTAGPDGAQPEPPAAEPPSSFAELVGRVNELEQAGVFFTGRADVAIDLDAQDTLGAASDTAWKALLALTDYVRARKAGHIDAGVDTYLRHTPPGYFTFPPGKHAATETRATLDRYGTERMFRCPASVASEEYILMTAHFKLGQIGMVSPRLYYLDRVATDGVVYVGYIGPHLTNTQTN